MRKIIEGHVCDTEKSRLIYNSSKFGTVFQIYITKTGYIFKNYDGNLLPISEEQKTQIAIYSPDFLKQITPLKTISFLLPEYYYDMIKSMPNSSEMLRDIVIDYLKGIDK